MQLNEREPFSEKKQSMFIWFLLAFLLGLSLRLLKLGEMRFTLNEAQLAQTAWQMANGEAVALLGNMSYAGLSAFLFHLFEPSFFFARLLPALFGSSLVLLPWFWRDKIGAKTALVLAVGLAIDPLLLNFSRQIVTPIFVLAGLCWAYTALKHKRPVLAGSMFAVAFLGGYSFWVVVLAGVVGLLIRRNNEKRSFDFSPFKSKNFLLPLLTSFVISLVMISSAFLLYTRGLGGIAAGLVELIQLFGKPYDFALYQPILIASAYSLLPLTFAIWTFADDLRHQQASKNGIYLLGWGLSVALSLILGRQDFGLLAFAAVFAWLGAAEGFERLISQKPQQREVVLGVTFFQVVILGYIMMVCRRLLSAQVNSQDFRYAAMAALAGVLLLVISTILVGMGWSRRVSGQALQNSLLIVLLTLTVGIGARSVGSQQESTTLSLLAGPILLPNNDVEAVMEEIDRIGKADKTEITCDLGDLEPQFSWFFRYQDDCKNSNSVSQADLMLSENAQNFSAADVYRGRNVALFRQIDPQVVKPGDFLKTLLGEPLPMISQSGVLWVRLNLFTGAN